MCARMCVYHKGSLGFGLKTFHPLFISRVYVTLKATHPYDTQSVISITATL